MLKNQRDHQSTTFSSSSPSSMCSSASSTSALYTSQEGGGVMVTRTRCPFSVSLYPSAETSINCGLSLRSSSHLFYFLGWYHQEWSGTPSYWLYLFHLVSIDIQHSKEKPELSVFQDFKLCFISWALTCKYLFLEVKKLKEVKKRRLNTGRLVLKKFEFRKIINVLFYLKYIYMYLCNESQHVKDNGQSKSCQHNLLWVWILTL